MADPEGPFRGRAGLLLASMIYNFSEPVLDGSKNMYTWFGRDQVLPLEIALGSVTLHHSKTPDCSPAICSQQPACGLPGGPGLRDVRMAIPLTHSLTLNLAL